MLRAVLLSVLLFLPTSVLHRRPSLFPACSSFSEFLNLSLPRPRPLPIPPTHPPPERRSGGGGSDENIGPVAVLGPSGHQLTTPPSAAAPSAAPSAAAAAAAGCAAATLGGGLRRRGGCGRGGEGGCDCAGREEGDTFVGSWRGVRRPRLRLGFVSWGCWTQTGPWEPVMCDGLMARKWDMCRHRRRRRRRGPWRMEI